jgi:hypothetical protein
VVDMGDDSNIANVGATHGKWPRVCYSWLRLPGYEAGRRERPTIVALAHRVGYAGLSRSEYAQSIDGVTAAG